MATIRRIVLSYGTNLAMLDGMLQDTLITTRRTTMFDRAQADRAQADRARISPWLNWRPNQRRPMPVLSIAELAECTCPDLCDRDHPNE
jgi:hypothetical protein